MLELEIEGVDVNFVAINKIDEVDGQEKLVEICSYPLFQDTEEVDAWELHGGAKDDIYIYDTTGHLHLYLGPDSEVPRNLSEAEGYDAVKAAIIAAQ